MKNTAVKLNCRLYALDHHQHSFGKSPAFFLHFSRYNAVKTLWFLRSSSLVDYWQELSIGKIIGKSEALSSSCSRLTSKLPSFQASKVSSVSNQNCSQAHYCDHHSLYKRHKDTNTARQLKIHKCTIAQIRKYVVNTQLLVHNARLQATLYCAKLSFNI